MFLGQGHGAFNLKSEGGRASRSWHAVARTACGPASTRAGGHWCSRDDHGASPRRSSNRLAPYVEDHVFLAFLRKVVPGRRPLESNGPSRKCASLTTPHLRLRQTSNTVVSVGADGDFLVDESLDPAWSQTSSSAMKLISTQAFHRFIKSKEEEEFDVPPWEDPRTFGGRAGTGPEAAFGLGVAGESPCVGCRVLNRALRDPHRTPSSGRRVDGVEVDVTTRIPSSSRRDDLGEVVRTSRRRGCARRRAPRRPLAIAAAPPLVPDVEYPDLGASIHATRLHPRYPRGGDGGGAVAAVDLGQSLSRGPRRRRSLRQHARNDAKRGSHRRGAAVGRRRSKERSRSC